MLEEEQIAERLSLHEDEKSAKTAGLFLCIMGFSWVFVGFSQYQRHGWSQMPITDVIILVEGVFLLFAGIGTTNRSLTAIRIGLLSALVGISGSIFSPKLFIIFCHVLAIVLTWQGHSAMMRLHKRKEKG